MSQFLNYGYGNYYNNNPGCLNLRTIIGAAVVLFGIISYFTHESVNPITGEHQHVSMTADDEIALGLQSAPQMAAQMGGEIPSTDPKAAEVQHIGQIIVTANKLADKPYHYQYHLLNDTQTVNAFALPGGQIFITMGLYEKLSDEAELASVLARIIP